MKTAKNLFSILAISFVLVGCGGNDSPVLSTLPQTQNPQSPWGFYNGGGCVPGTIVQNYHQYTVSWPSDNQYFSLANVCANAILFMKGNSDEDLHVTNSAGQDELFTRAELDAGKSVTFTNGGPLTMYCTSCNDLDVHWDMISIAY